ncbi:MAG TPA: sigma-70 family RNA polymerase sigma factor [Thermoanaerobaculia bacterium]|nr:sigma-70 family RNA polymerase sigma factor [Thermoanaerobaculia bacterium]
MTDEETSTAWRSAWESERGALLAFLRRRLRNEEAAEDLLQETFVRAIRAGRVDRGEELRPYLFTIAHHLVADHWRRRFRLVPRTAAVAADGGLEAIADERSESPEAEAGRRGIERRVREAMAALPERYQRAFRLAAVEQRSYREIAEVTGWSLDQVRINVHRARRRLIDELGSELVAEMRS